MLLHEDQAWTHIVSSGLYPASRLAGGLDKTPEPPNEAQVALCARWLTLYAVATKTIRHARTSYGLKHAVESWSKSLPVVEKWPTPPVEWLGAKSIEEARSRGIWWSDRFYVSNGAFIEAARRAGYHIVRDGPGSPNACFNLTIKKSA